MLVCVFPLCLARVFACKTFVARRSVSVVGGLLVRAAIVVLCSLAMMAAGLGVMFRCFAVMFRGFFRHTIVTPGRGPGG